MDGSHGRYRPDIDGLRAIAVLAVVAFHAFPDAIRGGFVGVDVFFVISGFLISRILFIDLARGSFSFRRFYAKRIRRIFPALLLVLASVLVLGWWLLLSNEYRLLGKHVAAGGGFVANIALWRESGYFDGIASRKPLLHLWSLGIEEQFYLLWPALVWLGWQSRRRLFPVIGVTFVLSFLLNVILIHVRPTATFYLPVTRFWELMTGCSIAYWQVRHAGTQTPVVRMPLNAVACCGLGLLLGSIALLDSAKLFPGWWAVLPVAGTALLIVSGPDAWLNRTVLSRRWLVGVGLISYPLYLWHWPLLAFLNIRGPFSSPALRLELVAVAFVLAVITYRFVERPVRFNASRHTPAVLMASMALIIASGAIVRAGRIKADAYPRDLPITEAEADWGFPAPDSSVLGFPAVTISAGGSPILWIGDSHIQQYYPRVRQLIHQHPDSHAAIFLTNNGCPAFPAVTEPRRACPDIITHLVDIAAATHASAIVVGSAWTEYLGHGSTYVFSVGGHGYGLETATGRGLAFQGLGGLLKQAHAAGLRLYVMLDVPSGRQADPGSMVRRNLLTGLSFHPANLPRGQFESEYSSINSTLMSIAGAVSATVIDPVPHLCGPTVCATTQDGVAPKYKDADHLRASYVREHVRYIDSIVLTK